jgi:hypothetical protein
MKIHTNVTNVKQIEPWLNDKSFNHINKIVISALVMFTENVNILKGVVNGATPIISHLSFLIIKTMLQQ